MMKDENCIVIGINSTGIGDGIAIGDNVNVLPGKVVVGDTLFGTEVPEETKEMIVNNPEGFRYFIQTLLSVINDLFYTGPTESDNITNLHRDK